MMMNKRITFGIIAILILLVGLWNMTPHQTAFSYKNHDPEVQYTGDEECAACHADIYNSFIRTGMGRSFYTAESAVVIEDYADTVTVYDPKENYHYSVFLKEDGHYQAEYRLNDLGEKTHELIRKADYIIGSGNHNRTYLTSQSGLVKELPLTWYVDKQKWDLSPGYHSTNMRFFRPIVEECMHCHNSFTDMLEHSQNIYTEPLPEGIGCERCHGPGQLHVKLRMENNETLNNLPDPSIINPRHLPFQEQLDVCQQCHLQGEISVFSQDKESSDFRPGMLLSSIKNIFMNKDPNPDEFRIASHAERMMKSECFQKSNSLTCITCHDPHVPVQEHSRDSFNQQCMSCHDLNALQMVTTENHEAASDCIQCHMPQGGTADIPHVNFTDHKIQIKRPGINDQPVKNSQDKKPAIQLANTFSTDPISDDILTGIAYVRFYESRHQHRAYLDMAIALLETALQKKDGNSDGWYHLGRAYHLLGQVEKANYAYTETTDQDPAYPLAWVQMGVLNMISDQHPSALLNFNRSTKLNPYDPIVWNNYGSALLFSDSANAALNAFSKAIALDPDYTNAYNNRGEILLYHYNDLINSKQDFSRSLVLDPDHVIALHNMGNIAVLEEDWPNAQAFASRALGVNSRFAPAYGTLATVFIRQGLIDEARSALSTIIKLEPNNEDARKILDSLHD